jgi:hypothetical protein
MQFRAPFFKTSMTYQNNLIRDGHFAGKQLRLNLGIWAR